MTTGAPDPVFAEPWHGQVFALTVHLNERGFFDWPDWTARFGATLARHGLSRSLNGGDDYFCAWLETLESFLNGEGHVNATEVDRVKADWEAAYLSTPHGQPVRLTGQKSTDTRT